MTAREDPLDAARAMLREKFGFADFRPGQAEAIGAVLNGEDLVAIYPTGAGKSLIFQLPALMRPGVALIVSPLVALMRDQVEKMRARGVKAAALYAGQSDAERRELMRDLDAGRLKLLYLAPERLSLPGTAEGLRATQLSLLAVDEAHCVSHWGHDFRPDYLNIKSFAQQIGGPQMLALTATAAPATRADLIDQLFSRPPRLIAASLRRPNLRLAAAARRGDGHGQIRDFVTARPGQSGVVYCSSRAGTERLAEFLRGAGVEALAYHAGLPADQRARRQDRFVARSDLVMTATIAFGLGVDKPDLRYILHLDPPQNLETLYQESGRAGRDGKAAEALALYDDRGLFLGRSLRGASCADYFLADYFLGLDCREQRLLAHFGEHVDPCGHCDNCRRGVLDAGVMRARRAIRALPGQLADWIDRHFVAPVETGAPIGAERQAAPAPAPSPQSEWTVAERHCLERLRQIRQICARAAQLAPERLLPDQQLGGWVRRHRQSGAAQERAAQNREIWEAEFDALIAMREARARAALARAREEFWRELAGDAI